MARVTGITAGWILTLPVAALAQRPDEDTLRALARRCGSEVEWVTSWEEAGRRARKERRPVLVLFRSLAGFDLPDGAMLGPFMDPDVIELVRHRFVALRFQKGMEAPFVDQESYGIGPLAFGTSILVATPSGEIVADTFNLEASTLLDFLAREASSYPPPPQGRSLEDKELPAWYLASGQLDAAAALLETPATPEEHLLKATLLRRRRMGTAALSELAAAERGFAGAAPVELHRERVDLLNALGRTAEAEQVLLTLPPEVRRDPAIRSRIMARELAAGHLETAREHAEALVRDHPERPEAWVVAALLVADYLPLLAGEAPATWPTPEIVATLRRHAPAPLPTRRLEEARRTAFDFLRKAQRNDGSWVHPAEVMTRVAPTLNPFVEAITALSARALLPFRDEAGVEEQVTRALAFLYASREHLAREGAPFSVMDYSVWSKPCVMLFVIDALAAGVAAADTWNPILQELLTELERSQRPNGGWTYYKGTELQSLDPALDVSFSFVTAFELIALAAARDHGLPVSEAMVQKAVDCMRLLRNRDGTFEYQVSQRNRPARASDPAGSAGRDAYCAHALSLWERTPVADREEALDRFLEHRASYAHEHGKSVMHCGPAGQGSHYLMFDYAFLAETIAALPRARQSRHRAALLEQVLEQRSVVGSYLDNPLLGDPFGTAMALWVFHRLQPGSPPGEAR